MNYSIRVRILNREYSLFVQEEYEALTREVAAFVDEKMLAFKNAHPEQTDLTTAIITALAIAEELHTALEDQNMLLAEINDTSNSLFQKLGEALELGEEEEKDMPIETEKKEALD